MARRHAPSCVPCAGAERRCGSRSTPSPTARAPPRHRQQRPVPRCRLRLVCRRRPRPMASWTSPSSTAMSRLDVSALPGRRAPQGREKARIGQYRAHRVEIVAFGGRAGARRRREHRLTPVTFEIRPKALRVCPELGRAMVPCGARAGRAWQARIGLHPGRRSRRPGPRVRLSAGYVAGISPGRSSSQSIRSRRIPMARRCSRDCCSDW